MKLLSTLFLVCAVHAKEFSFDDFLRFGDEPYYKPTFVDLSRRPLPEWFHRAKIGIFLHWGPYSVSSIGESRTQNGYNGPGAEWFWMNLKSKTCRNNLRNKYMEQNFPPETTYQDMIPMFTAELFDPNQWMDIFKKAGAKYVVLTTKHHDGYMLFPAKSSFNWNSVDTGPHLDLVDLVSSAARARGLEFGAYYSLMEPFHPVARDDVQKELKQNEYIKSKVTPDLRQLILDYKPSLIWADGDWDFPSEYWNATNFISWLYNESPVKDKVVVNNRWGRDDRIQSGDFYTVEIPYEPLSDRYKRKWECELSLDMSSWGYRRNMVLSDVITDKQLIATVVIVVSNGGNILINVGPTAEGIIPHIFQKKLHSLGKFLDVNGEAIYGASKWYHQQDTLEKCVWYTCQTTYYDPLHSVDSPKRSDLVKTIYATLFDWPEDNVLLLRDIASEMNSFKYQIELLGHDFLPLQWRVIQKKGVEIQLPKFSTVTTKYAWTLKFAKITA